MATIYSGVANGVHKNSTLTGGAGQSKLPFGVAAWSIRGFVATCNNWLPLCQQWFWLCTVCTCESCQVHAVFYVNFWDH